MVYDKKIVKKIHDLMSKGYSESKAYYTVFKDITPERVLKQPPKFFDSNNRNNAFILNPELIALQQLQQLQELKEIKRLLSELLNKGL